MKILAVDTATEACSAALLNDQSILFKFQIAPREHSKLILTMIDSLMAEASHKVSDLDAIAFGCGPGSFTGIRIATGVVHGIAFGADLPVLPISNLAAIAQQGYEKGIKDIIFTAMDARMGEIYWAEYQQNVQGFAELIGQERVLPVQSIPQTENSGTLLGTAWPLYEQELSQHLQARLLGGQGGFLPRAEDIVRLAADHYQAGAAVSVEQAMPVYLRDKVAKKQFER